MEDAVLYFRFIVGFLITAYFGVFAILGIVRGKIAIRSMKPPYDSVEVKFKEDPVHFVISLLFWLVITSPFVYYTSLVGLEILKLG